MIALLDTILMGLTAVAIIVFSLVALFALFRLADAPSEAELRWLHLGCEKPELYDWEQAA